MEKGQLIKVIIIAVCLIGAVVLIAIQVMPSGSGGPTGETADGESVRLTPPKP